MFADAEEESSNPLDHFWLEGDSLAPPCQADLDVVHALLDLAAPHVNSESAVYDLGCGDGRICIEATKRFGCDSIGCEIEPHLIEKFRKNVVELGLESKVTIVSGDLKDLNLDRLGVVSIYLLPESVASIRDTLVSFLRRGGVIIFNTWGLKDLPYKTKTTCGYANNCSLYLYDGSCLPAVEKSNNETE